MQWRYAMIAKLGRSMWLMIMGDSLLMDENHTLFKSTGWTQFTEIIFLYRQYLYMCRGTLLILTLHLQIPDSSYTGRVLRYIYRGKSREQNAFSGEGYWRWQFMVDFMEGG